MNTWKLSQSLLILAIFSPLVHAWGPHSQITGDALEVLPDKAKLKRYLGKDFNRIAKDYCWMADWREAVRPDHYPDDYLRFPTMPEHLSHMLPDVRKTYTPFFRRALQAIRMESPQNAARWVGSLLHFVQDSGSPPHTTGIGGLLHAKMEQWVDESKISIAGYKPRLLGRNEDEALKGFHSRMDHLVAFSQVRAIKLKPILEKLNKRLNQPLELESALETARVSADVVHTLFSLGLENSRKVGGTLAGKLNYQSPLRYPAVPAKVMLADTSYSTTTDDVGNFQLRHVPPRRYRILILATGYEAKEVADVAIVAGKTTVLQPGLKVDSVAGNLIRNPRFQISWIKPKEPDWWTRDGHLGGCWASALVRVPLGQTCNIQIEFAGKEQFPVHVRWRSNPASLAPGKVVSPKFGKDVVPRVLRAKVAPDQFLKPFEKGHLYLELLLQTRESPAKACKHVAVTWVEK